MIVLGIETSCDDTSVALVNSEREVLHCRIANQNALHSPFGGVVPEIASRNHSYHLLRMIHEMVDETQISWDEITGLAVTNRPGLIGSLIVGLVTTKTLALAKNIPFIGVHHIEGHIAAPFLWDQDYRGASFIDKPFVALVVSGGHTSLFDVEDWGRYKLLGETRDDAAGEAFDKFAKMLNLPYPGGVEVDQLAAQGGDVRAYSFPRPLANSRDFNMSFSGLKSAGHRLVEELGPIEEKSQVVNDLCASYQEAIVDVLVAKTMAAMKYCGKKKLVVTGGVSANSRLRAQMAKHCKKFGYELAVPPLRYCTDNAAMIALAGLKRLEKGEVSFQNLGPIARIPL